MNTVFSRPTRGFTLVEMLVVIAIIAVLAGIMMPILGKARDKGRQTACVSNQHQLALAVAIYGEDHDAFPGPYWFREMTNLGKATECPSYPDSEVGYGYNGFLCNRKPGTISNPSETVVTTDSSLIVTTYGEFGRSGRHNKGAVFARLDGSAVWAKEAGKGGRFACGKFPIDPLPQIGTLESVKEELPISFETLSADEWIAGNMFLICGPYGDGSENVKEQLDNDYIRETLFASRYAEDAPCPFVLAPGQDAIVAPGSSDTAVSSGRGVTQLKHWTKPNATTIGMDKFENAYNCKFPQRTSYAAAYIYSASDQVAQITWGFDDGGIMWLNGERIVRDETTDDNLVDRTGSGTGAGTPPEIWWSKPGGVRIPKGISFLLVKISNSATGGMKAKVKFNVPLSVSPVLE